MMDHPHLALLNRNTTINTTTVGFVSRPTQGTGVYTNIPGMASLSFISSSRDVSLTAADLIESVVQYVNSALPPGTFEPETGTVEQAVRAALTGFTTYWATTRSYSLLFDGQYGTVMLGQ